jgi:3-dehydroquinate synthase
VRPAEESNRVIWQDFSVRWRFPVIFTRNMFAPSNSVLADVMDGEGKALLLPLADAGVASAHPELENAIEACAARYEERMELVSPLQVLPGGEGCKDGDRQVAELHRLLLSYGLCRHSIVLAIGGGAFLDVVGYAAATAHRGIRLVRVPTTTLAQNDAGVGVKNGYNAFGRKNWAGTFAPPHAVINDFDFLRTLPERHCRAGLAEAVKIAVIKEAPFFHWLHRERVNLARLRLPYVEEAVTRCAILHLEHIAVGDPFERGNARPLDFGHWAAHALEEATGGEILHGEGVAIGMALDAIYAAMTGLLPEGERDAILGLLQDLGFRLMHPALTKLDLEASLDRFRQHLGGRLSITLPISIGRRRDVPEVDMPLMQRSRSLLMNRPEV